MATSDTDEASEVPPPKNDGDVNTILDLSVGDRVLIETRANYAPDRILIVTETESDAKSSDILAFRGDDDGYILEGYGTEYHLITTGTPHWQRVDIVFKTHPTGQTVSNIEVLDTDSSADK